ncbi:hypothetical protein CSB45_04930 [candidate division KSB3 bacterium]|uniref:Uncharacterized protein n=1 Tax=candidate division KSB3 bacterium TaxID=2044937 RepID=A0A2G6E7G9_9BACT|nr:MAG: hypothetical protein CSB45_04930 [candidate division KSB3 bacterium]
MFANRFGLYPPEKLVVLTNTVENSEAFDATVDYSILRVPLPWDGPKYYEWLGVVWRLVKTGFAVIRRQNIEVIECARPFPEGVAAYILAKLCRKPFVSNVHGDEVTVFQNYKIERFLIQRVVRAARLNLANSRSTEKLIQDLAGKDLRTAVVYPGFNTDFLQHVNSENVAALRTRFQGEPILLTVGRLEQERKGHDNVIRALPKVVSQFPGLKYVIVSSLTDKAKTRMRVLKELADQLNVSDHIIWCGEVAHDALAEYYAACDLFMMPNRVGPAGDVEGFGIVFLEAGFLEKPVIGGNSGGVPDAVQHENTGLLVDGDNADSIADGILKILSDNNLANKMGEHGKSFALTMTHQKVFEKYKALMSTSG